MITAWDVFVSLRLIYTLYIYHFRESIADGSVALRYHPTLIITQHKKRKIWSQHHEIESSKQYIKNVDQERSGHFSREN